MTTQEKIQKLHKKLSYLEGIKTHDVFLKKEICKKLIKIIADEVEAALTYNNVFDVSYWQEIKKNSKND
jgi:hypothetical protein